MSKLLLLLPLGWPGLSSRFALVSCVCVCVRLLIFYDHIIQYIQYIYNNRNDGKGEINALEKFAHRVEAEREQKRDVYSFARVSVCIQHIHTQHTRISAGCCCWRKRRRKWKNERLPIRLMSCGARRLIHHQYTV